MSTVRVVLVDQVFNEVKTILDDLPLSHCVVNIRRSIGAVRLNSESTGSIGRFHLGLVSSRFCLGLKLFF